VFQHLNTILERTYRCSRSSTRYCATLFCHSQSFQPSGQSLHMSCTYRQQAAQKIARTCMLARLVRVDYEEIHSPAKAHSLTKWRPIVKGSFGQNQTFVRVDCSELGIAKFDQMIGAFPLELRIVWRCLKNLLLLLLVHFSASRLSCECQQPTFLGGEIRRKSYVLLSVAFETRKGCQLKGPSSHTPNVDPSHLMRKFWEEVLEVQKFGWPTCKSGRCRRGGCLLLCTLPL
jgi:hypothetical protein